MPVGLFASVRLVLVVFVLNALAAGAAGAAREPRGERPPQVLAPALANPGLPAFGEDGSVVVEGTDETGSYPRSEIEWIRADGYATRWALPRELERDVQSLYIDRGTLWLLLDDPTVDHQGAPPPPRRYEFARMSWDGVVTRVVPGAAAPWHLQTSGDRSRGGIWARTGVYWTADAARLPEPDGLNWADTSGFDHQPWNSPVSLRGTPDEGLGVASDGTLWTAVTDLAASVTRPRLGPDGIDRIDVAQREPVVTKFPLRGEQRPAQIVPDVASGALWFSELDGSIGRLSETGSVENFAWRPGAYKGSALFARRPSALLAAPDGGVWTFGEATARHITARGEVGAFPVPRFADGPPAFENSVALSPCGVFWIRSGGALWSWRPQRFGAATCLDAAAVKPSSLRTARLAGF
jgi:hypothetical protein